MERPPGDSPAHGLQSEVGKEDFFPKFNTSATEEGEPGGISKDFSRQEGAWEEHSKDLLLQIMANGGKRNDQKQSRGGQEFYVEAPTDPKGGLGGTTRLNFSQL